MYSGIYDIQGIKRELGVEPSKIIIGMVAAFRPIKGQLYLVEAISKIIEKHKDIQAVLVGCEDVNYFNTVKKRIEELKLQDYFVLTGQREDIPRLLSVFDIFVISSVNEGFSNAILEAMAAGKPVIAPDSGGNPEAVEHKKTGLLFKPCDSISLAEALQQLIEDKNLRQWMGEAGRFKVKQNFLLDGMLRQNEELYQYHLYKPDLKEIFRLWRERVKTFYIKKFIKISLSYICYYSGFSWIYKRFFSGGVKALAYHSISNITLRPLEIEQNPQNFEQQMVYLKKYYTILTLSEFFRYLKNGHKYPDNSVLITFNDGYRDNYINAYPVLKKLGIPAAIFLTADPLEQNTPLFYDVLRYCITNTGHKILDLEDCGLDKYILYRDELHLKKIINEITNYCKKLPRGKVMELTDTVMERLSFNREHFSSLKFYLDWDEIMEMSEDGMEFGAHTVSHSSLGYINAEQIRKEILDSKKIIERHLGKKVTAFAYPFGGISDYSSAADSILAEGGYECAFTLLRESNAPYRVGRKAVDSHMTAKFNGSFCKALFECEMLDLF